jgi:hypothetical protein
LLPQILKARLLGLAAIDRMKWKQSGSKLGLPTADFFFPRANGRQKNHVPSLVDANGAEVSDHVAKTFVLHNHFAWNNHYQASQFKAEML